MLVFMEESNNFGIDEIAAISHTITGLIGQTTYCIQALTIVLTDYFAEMNDSERIKLINDFLTQLDEDMAVINAFIREVQILNYQRMSLRTLDYMRKSWSGEYETAGH